MANLTPESAGKNGVASEFKNKIHSSEQQLEKMVHNVGEKIGTMASDFTNTTADSMKQGRDYVQENPVKGIAIAAAAGLVAGSLLTIIARSRRE